MIFESVDPDQTIFILAGDTHGGQIPLPSWLWRLLGYEKCARYNEGFFEEGRKKMFVSRGIGRSTFPLRIGKTPQVAVFHFR